MWVKHYEIRTRWRRRPPVIFGGAAAASMGRFGTICAAIIARGCRAQLAKGASGVAFHSRICRGGRREHSKDTAERLGVRRINCHRSFGMEGKKRREEDR